MDTLDDDARTLRLGQARRSRIESARHDPRAWAKVWTRKDIEALGAARVEELREHGDWRDDDIRALGEMRLTTLLDARYWTTQDVADWHGVKDRTAYQWYNRKKVRPEKFGAANSYPRAVAMGITPKPKGRRPRQDATA